MSTVWTRLSSNKRYAYSGAAEAGWRPRASPKKSRPVRTRASTMARAHSRSICLWRIMVSAHVVPVVGDQDYVVHPRHGPQLVDKAGVRLPQAHLKVQLDLPRGDRLALQVQAAHPGLHQGADL